MKKLIITIILIFICSSASAETLYPENLWQGLMGEAVSEGYKGMYAVGCVYRNRIRQGKGLGCVALKRRALAQWCAKQGIKYEGMAKDIIYKLFILDYPDITGGATHYEAIEKYGKPYWVKDMVKTIKIGEHTFYKEKIK